MEARNMFVSGWNSLALTVHTTAVEKGWWEPPEAARELTGFLEQEVPNQEVRKAMQERVETLASRNNGEILALVHSELSEALEGLRHGDPESQKIPGFSALEEEYADALIRIMDHAAHLDLRVAEALVAKMDYNGMRTYKHGGKAF